MKKLCLNGVWQMRAASETAWRTAQVPGSVAETLLAHGIMPDPYYRDNEEKVQSFFEEDYLFCRTFFVEESTLACDRVRLCCEGLDTIAELSLNGQVLATVDNMHRTWVFHVKELLKPGENEILIRFFSPLKYLEAHPSGTGKKFATIRKAACMFGWDWGLSLPDMGIWRDIYLETYNAARLDWVQITQTHKAGSVRLQAAVHADVWGKNVQLRMTLRAPDGVVLFSKTMSPAAKQTTFVFSVSDPKLWWPAGYGAQPLYTLKTALVQDGTVLDCREQQVGLRTLCLNRDKKPGGSNYGFVVNGVPIFFKGENLIIEDAFTARTTPARWDTILQNCILSNLNGIRVWGGAYYPPDYFYAQCDRLGLLVWQDFMFACTFYMPTKPFLENVEAELADNLKRIAHHPSLALLCGNNEVESMYTVIGSKEPETVALRKLFGQGKRFGFLLRTLIWVIYKKLFLKVIPACCMRYAPQTSYVHSSPSTRKPRGASSFYDYLTDGDMHYYLQYNDNAPYQKLRTVQCRFMTEMGFQSYPSLKTIAAFAAPEERNPYSPVMYAHQKCKNGNEAIELYMARDYIIPNSFAEYIYLSQLQAGEIMAYSVEHLRRMSGYCNGMILWQLNDCWPVVSWSGIDYFGRWKAQQYYTKRFYAPVLVSACEEGAAVSLWVTNNTLHGVSGTLNWTLYGGTTVLQKGAEHITAPAGSSNITIECDFSDIIQKDRARAVLCYSLSLDEKDVSFGSVLFCLAKDFCFEPPKLDVNIKENEDGFVIHITSDVYVKGLALDLKEGDCLFSDNFFDLPPGKMKCVTVKQSDMKSDAGLTKENLLFTCLNDVMLRGRGEASQTERMQP